MTEQDIRWQQRYRQFNRAYLLLVQAIAIESPNIVERAGLIQFFEMAFELSWKLLKDYQQAEGFEVNSPRAAIKLAFQNGIVDDGHVWIQALEDRNLTTHTYNEETAQQVEKKIRETYFPLLNVLNNRFSELEIE
ncbi:nucleotidyltransferase [Nitrincola tibetensis]|uniref:Nucleotidyltransferase n=1 Tax=Nitrincola tibetensis TaxID=2219697 RepID=A0A364NHQ3_9GAMM|nr:nucleotidyltransferase substrate binding protein [Nitrincola tibetensis]RAU16649.1 nucleotidyltransferase [Nitrincola tibetensis]